MPKAVVTDGRSVDEYIPQHLRDMFYKSSYPEYTYATTNGYGPYDFSTKGLVLYLPLFALKGSPFKSVDAYQHTCTVYGAPWRSHGRYFDGTDDYVSVPDCASLSALTALTLECWMKTGNTRSYGNLLSKYYHATKQEFNLMWRTTTGTPRFEVYDLSEGASVGITIAYDLADDVWNHVVVTWDGGTDYTSMALYVNGASKTTTDIDFGTFVAIEDSDQPVLIGRQGNLAARDFEGDMGEVRIYSRALPAAETLHNYKCTVWRYQ